jgi:uroporphyrinogen decarboxylase
MNPRERVLTTLNHQEPDKVPIDLGATQVTTITRVAYRNLRQFLAVEPEPAPRICDIAQDVIYPKEDLLLYYQVDFRPVQLKGPWVFEPKMMDDDSFYDEYNLRWKRAAFYYDAVERPLANASLGDLDKAVWPDPYDPGRVHGLQEEARRLYNETDYCLVADIMCGGPFEQACMLRGYEQFCVDLCQDEKFATTLLDKITETDIAFWEVFLNAVGKYVQVVAQGDDVGMQTRTYISPAMIRKFIKPRLKRIFDYIHAHTNAKVFFHSCGSIYDIIPDLIEIGVDILNPIQRSAANMDIIRLKKEFGKDLCFWGGGIDVQQVFPFATLEEIDREVQYTLDVMAPGGGYVFVPAHNIQPDVSPDRIDRLYQAVIQKR